MHNPITTERAVKRNNNTDQFPPTQREHGWFMACRSTDGLELLKANPNALVLAYVIAHRACYREGFNSEGLQLGEAKLGDHENYGMTEQNYRTAKAQLEKWHFATFKSTNKGTLGKLIGSRLFSFNPLEPNDQSNERVTSSQRAGNDRVTTNIEHIEQENYKTKKDVGRNSPSQSPCAAAAAPTSTDAEWLAGLKSDAAYQGIDIDREHGKMRNWCRLNHKQPTRRRFINWLNRCDIPTDSKASEPPAPRPAWYDSL